MKKDLTFHNGWLNSWRLIIHHFCLEKPICGVGSDIMQIINGRRVVGFYFPTTHYYNKLLNIKLGTSVHLKTCFVWLISLCWLSDHHRSRFLWKCYRYALFPLPRRSSTLYRLSVLRKAGFWPLFWHRWGSESWQIRRSTACDWSRSVTTFFRWYVHLLFELAHLALTEAALTWGRLGKSHHIRNLLPDFVKWR